MKYQCTIIIYKENKHINVSYDVKKTMKKCKLQEKLKTPNNHFFGF